MQGPLYEYLKSRGVRESSQPKLAAKIDALVKAEIAGRDPHAAIKPPLPELTPMQIQAVIRCGMRWPWRKHLDHGDPIGWVADKYGEWIPGLLRSHLKVADPLLLRAFHRRAAREGGLPDWLDVPSQREAALRKVTDPQQRKKLLAGRVLQRIGANSVRCP